MSFVLQPCQLLLAILAGWAQPVRSKDWAVAKNGSASAVSHRNGLYI